MTIEEMKNRKQELGYSSEQLAELAGLPVSTVRKIMGGITKSPRRDTVQALEKVLRKRQGDYTADDFDALPEGINVELINGMFYGREGSDPLSQGTVDAMFAMEAPFTYGNLALSNTTNRNVDDEFYKPKGPKTVADYEAQPEGWRGELIDGELVALAAPTVRHQRIVLEIFRQLDSFARSNSEHKCEVLTSPIGVQLQDGINEVFEPDIVVICDPSKDKNKRIIGAPDLIAEVLSPSTKKNDLIVKLDKYTHYGVREYLIIDGDKRTVTSYFVEGDCIADLYSFDEKIPIGISNGALKIDLSGL